MSEVNPKDVKQMTRNVRVFYSSSNSRRFVPVVIALLILTVVVLDNRVEALCLSHVVLISTISLILESLILVTKYKHAIYLSAK